MVPVPWQRQAISAASAVSAKGAFWFATYAGGLNGALFVTLLRRKMRGRRKPLQLIVDGLPAAQDASGARLLEQTRGQNDAVFSAGLRSGPQSRRTGLEPRQAHRQRTSTAAKGRAPRTAGSAKHQACRAN